MMVKNYRRICRQIAAAVLAGGLLSAMPAWAERIKVGEMALEYAPPWQRATPAEENAENSVILRWGSDGDPLKVYFPHQLVELQFGQARFYQQLQESWRTQYGAQARIDWLELGGVRWLVCRRPSVAGDATVYQVVTVQGNLVHHLLVLVPGRPYELPWPVMDLLTVTQWGGAGPSSSRAAPVMAGADLPETLARLQVPGLDDPVAPAPGTVVAAAPASAPAPAALTVTSGGSGDPPPVPAVATAALAPATTPDSREAPLGELQGELLRAAREEAAEELSNPAAALTPRTASRAVAPREPVQPADMDTPPAPAPRSPSLALAAATPAGVGDGAAARPGPATPEALPPPAAGPVREPVPAPSVQPSPAAPPAPPSAVPARAAPVGPSTTWELKRVVHALPQGDELAELARLEGRRLGSRGTVLGYGLLPLESGMAGFIEGFLWHKDAAGKDVKQSFARQWDASWSMPPATWKSGEPWHLELALAARADPAAADRPALRFELLPLCGPRPAVVAALNALERRDAGAAGQLARLAAGCIEPEEDAPRARLARPPAGGAREKLDIPLPAAWADGIKAPAGAVRRIALVVNLSASETGETLGDALWRPAAVYYVYVPQGE